MKRMSEEKKLSVLTTLISNLWYTLAESPIVDQALYGDWRPALTLPEFIPAYLVGLIVCFWIPWASWAHRVQDALFSGVKKEPGHYLLTLFLEAAVYEFCFALLCQFYFIFLFPSGSRDLNEMILTFIPAYLPCIIPNMLITHFLLPPTEKLAKKLLQNE